MGKRKKEAIKVVLDTNILVSALLFKGELSKIVDLWKKGRIIPFFSRETFDEFMRVLEYPKFSLTNTEIKTILEKEVLPYFEVVDVADEFKGVCRDPDDNKFLSCAVSASANLIVSGDKDLCDLRTYRSVRIVSAIEFIRMFD